jgi:hypothetical protein
MKGASEMDFGKLSLTHDILARIYDIAFHLKEDETFTKEMTVEAIKVTILQMNELTELIQLDCNNGQSGTHKHEVKEAIK